VSSARRTAHKVHIFLFSASKAMRPSHTLQADHQSVDIGELWRWAHALVDWATTHESKRAVAPADSPAMSVITSAAGLAPSDPTFLGVEV
jgi:hypothetical protein